MIPPIRIKNGLPVMLQIAITGKDFECLLEKSEEKHISFYSPENDIELLVKIDGYKQAALPVKFLKKSSEKYITLYSEDNRHSTLNLFINFSDNKAG